MAFGVWLSLVASRPLAHPELYLHKLLPEAVPKYISGRTSYLQVRLAFHPYPQLIPALCHVHGFGPPPKVSLVSSWPWVAHLVSCLIHATLPQGDTPYSDSLSLRLRNLYYLTQPHRSTRRLILQ